MAKAAPDAMIDASLNYVAGSTLLVVCSSQPTSYAEATTTYALTSVVVDGADFTVADDTSGRKVTVSAQSDIVIGTSGTAAHLALVATSGTTLRYVTTCTSQALTANGTNTVSTPAFKVSIADPT